MASRGSFGVGPQGPAGLSTGPAGGDLGGNFPDPTVVATANVESIIRANRLDQLAAPTAAVSLGNQKLTNVANATVATDVATFGQVPTTLPPSGSAGGDFTGTYPNPTLTGTANVNNVVRANSLSQMAAPQADINMNNKKLVGLAGGVAASDAVSISQLPVAGTGSNNYAAGNDSRIVGAAQKSANLSDMASASTSRTNLGLGNVATRNVGNAFGQVPDAESIGVDTGIVSGGELNANITNPLSLDIGATVGYIADYTTTPGTLTLTRVATNAQTVALTNITRAITWWMIDINGNIIQQGNRPTNTQRRQNLQLGATVQNGVQIFVDQTLPVIVPHPTNQLYDFMYALGSFNIDGNTISTTGANLQFQQAGGSVFAVGFNHFAGATLTNDPHVSTTVAQNPAQFRYTTQSAAAAGSLINTLDPTKYDNGGVITTNPSGGGSATVQRVYLFPENTAADQLVIQYGQTVFTSLSNAINSIGGSTPYVRNPNIPDGILLAYIVMTKSCTDLTDATRASIIMANRFALN